MIQRVKTILKDWLTHRQGWLVKPFRNRVYPATFIEETNEQCRIFFVLYAPPFFVAWLPYLAIDPLLFPNEPLIPMLRVGLTFTGVVALLARLFLRYPQRHRIIANAMMYYLIIATGIITGLAKGHPSYIGGYCFLITVLSATPIELRHLYTALGLSLTIFASLCWQSGVSFATPSLRYSLQDLISTVAVNGILSYGWMLLRRNSYEKGRALQELNFRSNRQQQILEEQNAALLHLNTEKNEIVGIVSHDLRNPLTTILGYAEVTRSSNYALDISEYQRFSQQIHDAATRMLGLIQRLLDVNALESGRMPIEFGTVNISEVARSVVEQYQSIAAEKSITLLYESVPNAFALADTSFVHQILENLISNALKYSPQGRSVFITIDKNDKNEQQSSTINSQFPTLHAQFSIFISVRDEGEGISPEDMQRLFGKFVRLTAKPTGGEHSTGLGLSIVKRMVEAMHGRVWCESERGKGATFIVELPYMY